MLNTQIIFLFIIIIIIYIFVKTTTNDVLMIQSTIDKTFYLVNNLPDKQNACDILAEIKQRLGYLRDFLVKNKMKNKQYIKYINLLDTRFDNIIIKEKTEKNNFTSYSINKGEEIIFCLRSKNNDVLHDLNLIMYVAIHEISHVACPEIGHTPLFKKIFKFFLEEAIKIKIYKYDDYYNNIKEYCGIYINESIID